MTVPREKQLAFLDTHAGTHMALRHEVVSVDEVFDEGGGVSYIGQHATDLMRCHLQLLVVFINTSTEVTEDDLIDVMVRHGIDSPTSARHLIAACQAKLKTLITDNPTPILDEIEEFPNP